MCDICKVVYYNEESYKTVVKPVVDVFSKDEKISLFVDGRVFADGGAVEVCPDYVTDDIIGLWQNAVSKYKADVEGNALIKLYKYSRDNSFDSVVDAVDSCIADSLILEDVKELFKRACFDHDYASGEFLEELHKCLKDRNE